MDFARTTKTINLSSAYLLPIPVVDVDVDFDDRDYERSSPVVANRYTSIGFPIAEPTEGTPLLHNT